MSIGNKVIEEDKQGDATMIATNENSTGK